MSTDAELYDRRVAAYLGAFIKAEGSMKAYKLARKTYRRAPSSYTKAVLERAVAWDFSIRLNSQ
jgi:hypothetical protein